MPPALTGSPPTVPEREPEPPLWEQWEAQGVRPADALTNVRPDLPQGDRLQKVLAQLGYGSRRSCEDIISAGRVTVDGVVATLGRRIDVSTAGVAVDGVPVSVKPGLVYYLLN